MKGGSSLPEGDRRPEKTVEATSERKIEATATPPRTASGAATSISSSISSTPTAADMACAFGQPCDLSGSTVTVTQVQFFRGVQHLGETPEGYFVAVDFDYAFYEEEPTRTGQPPFWLSDEDGKTYSLDTSAKSSYGTDAGRHLSHTVVQPGVTTPGAAVFEVAPQAMGFMGRKRAPARPGPVLRGLDPPVRTPVEFRKQDLVAAKIWFPQCGKGRKNTLSSGRYARKD